MSKKEVPLHALSAYLPENTLEPVLYYLNTYKILLTITRERRTILGDYRYAKGDSYHRISVNGNLNKYAFLITLLHELAHLITFEKFGRTVAPHGKEWKATFSHLLSRFLHLQVFPNDVTQALTRSVHNPAASSCADEFLMRVLRGYDMMKDDILLIEEITEGGLFQLEDGRIFKRGEKLRKRYKGHEVQTGKVYLFSPLYEVRPVQQR